MSEFLSSIPEPDLTTLLRQHRQEIFSSLNCHQVGTIVSFDPTKQSASVELSVSRLAGGEIVAYPKLVDCPVFVPSGGGGRLSFPVVAGDRCLVLFNDRNLDLWFSSGQTGVPNSPRCHSRADGLVIVGFRPAFSPLPGYSMTDAEFKFENGTISVANKLRLANADTNLKAVLDLVVTAMTALNLKTGPSAATQIAAASTAIAQLLKP
jgi:hypothetical protein